MRICIWVGVLLLPCGLTACAQGGPPFRTDDPETPGNKHLEINFGFVGARNPASGSYQVPDFDFNYGLGDRLQLKYELPIALEETRSQSSLDGTPAISGQVIGGLGESLLGIKWRFYEHHEGGARFANNFGTGLIGLFSHKAEDKPAASAGDSPGAVDAEPRVNLSISTYPQLFLDNPTRSVPRGLVAPGPSFYLPLEVNGRIGPLRVDAEVGYNFGNRNVPQSWGRGLLVGHEFSDSTEIYVELYDQQDANRVPAGRGLGQFATGFAKQRQLTLDVGGRQALNKRKVLNLLLMGGRSVQSVSADNSQPSWIAYVGLQVLIGPKAPEAAQAEPRLASEKR